MRDICFLLMHFSILGKPGWKQLSNAEAEAAVTCRNILSQGVSSPSAAVHMICKVLCIASRRTQINISTRSVSRCSDWTWCACRLVMQARPWRATRS